MWINPKSVSLFPSTATVYSVKWGSLKVELENVTRIEPTAFSLSLVGGKRKMGGGHPLSGVRLDAQHTRSLVP